MTNEPESRDAVDSFLDRDGVLLDVRSPAEYAQAHIPGARSLPLFRNDERHTVGLTYKEEGREVAIERGLEIVGPRLRPLLEQARRMAGPSRRVRVYCWRGGMRSDAVAWLLRFGGLEVERLVGGYKAFRRYVDEVLRRPMAIWIIGGMTGSGKTDLLHALATRGEQILDLEGLAHHLGSAFGGLGQPPQPSSEQFENRIAVAWRGFDPTRPLFVEDESRRLGRVAIPEPLWGQMRAAPVLEISVPREARLARLLRDYRALPAAELKAAVISIRKRLGGARTAEVLALIDGRRHREAADELLGYYDKAYRMAMSRRDDDAFVPIESADGAIDGLAERIVAESTSRQPGES
ncbi:MAG: tRNA 2-selenouridine(34) synthase MnmH [Myxococcales bacterium]|nr:tRNA 2-selenouridine(34) synthase MnmH [Myxococcales bacterium]